MVTARSLKENYTTEISSGKNKVFSDTTPEMGGKGEHFRPHDFVAAAYASCLNISARMAMDEMKIGYGEVIVDVELDRSDDSKVVFKYSIGIDGVDENTKNEVVEKIQLCSVKKTLLREISFVNLEEAEAGCSCAQQSTKADDCGGGCCL